MHQPLWSDSTIPLVRWKKNNKQTNKQTNPSINEPASKQNITQRKYHHCTDITRYVFKIYANLTLARNGHKNFFSLESSTWISILVFCWIFTFLNEKVANNMEMPTIMDTLVESAIYCYYLSTLQNTLENGTNIYSVTGHKWNVVISYFHINYPRIW